MSRSQLLVPLASPWLRTAEATRLTHHSKWIEWTDWAAFSTSTRSLHNESNIRTVRARPGLTGASLAVGVRPAGPLLGEA